MQFVPHFGDKSGQVIDFKDSEIPLIASTYIQKLELSAQSVQGLKPEKASSFFLKTLTAQAVSNPLRAHWAFPAIAWRTSQLARNLLKDSILYTTGYSSC